MTETPHNPCATCGVCCRSYVVNLCGYDVWLISTRQRLSPEQFLVACPQAEPGADGIRLGSEGPTYGLALDKHGKFRANQACVFLLRLGGGNDRCGIYAHRPVVCQSYPMAIGNNAVFQRQDALCPPDSWPPRETARPAWRAALQRLRLHYDVYAEVVARWNGRVAAAGPGARFSLHEYLSYLMNVYDRLAAPATALGAEEMERVEAAWPNLPRFPTDPPELPAFEDVPPWLGYLTRVRQVIDGFYPEIAPQRVLPIAPSETPDAEGAAHHAAVIYAGIALAAPNVGAPNEECSAGG